MDGAMSPNKADGGLTVVFFDTSEVPLNPHSCDGSTTSSSSSWASAVEGQLGLQTLVAQDWPHDQTITLKCSVTPSELRSSKQRGVRPAADLVQAVQSAWQQQPRCVQQHLVLVGHGFGGHLMKEACLQLQQGAVNPHLPAWQRQQYDCTLHSIRGLVFYSTPHEPLPRLALPEYEYLLPDMAAVCQRFRTMCSQHGWQTLGVGAAAQTGRQCVPLSAAAKGMTTFVAVPADQAGVSRPTSSSHPSFLALHHFLERLTKETGKDVAVLAADTDAAVAVVRLPCARASLTSKLLVGLVAV